MNKRIRNMIDGIFSEMKMTAENLALRDELMANAIARFEDAIAQGRTEEEAFAEVAVSLEDVSELLHDMNSEKAPEGEETAQPSAETDAPDEAQAKEENAQSEAPQTDLGDALNKAFTMLGDWGQSLMPQAKKLARQMDDATGGMLRDIGRAVNKGMREAQKAAGDVLDRIQQEKTVVTDSTAEEMREYAKDLKAQADLKRAVGDEEGAKALEEQAEALETQADVKEQAEAMEQARRSAEQETAQPQDKSPFAPAPESEAQPQEAQRPVYGADGELDEDAFARSVEQMSREAEEIVREAGDAIGDLGKQAQEAAGKAGEALHDAVYGKRDPQRKEVRFPAAGLRKIDVKLDADDVTIEPAQGDEVIVRWTAQNVEGEPAVTLSNHTLTIRRKNPDVFKTFFSVFSKNGGQIVICIPRGFAADYALSTTSGDVRLSGVDVDSVKVSTSSGDVRLEPDLSVRASDIKAESISGSITVSAMAVDIDAQSVSGDVFISCDAASVKGDVVSGKLHVEGACDDWDVNAVSGKAELVCTVVPTGKINADTISGSVTLYLPGSIRGFAVDFESINGALTNEFGPDRYGTCALPIRMNTISGRMIISRL